MCLDGILWEVHQDIQSNLFKMTTMGTYIKWSYWTSLILKRFYGEKFTKVAEKNVCLDVKALKSVCTFCTKIFDLVKNDVHNGKIQPQ